MILTMAQRHLNAIESTSAGRLFDAVSAILGIQKSSTFEGEASMALEFAAEAWQKEHEAKNTENTKNAQNAENVKNATNAKNGKHTDVKEHEHIFLQTNAIVWQMIEGKKTRGRCRKACVYISSVACNGDLRCLRKCTNAEEM